MGVRPKVSKGRSESPLVASAEAKSPDCNNMLFFQTLRLVCTTILVIAILPEGFPIALWTPSAVASHADGAVLQGFLVTGRDASLPAPLLSAFAMLVARGTVGALPQTPAGAPPLHPARGRRKGTKSPLDPFWAARLGRFFHTTNAPAVFRCRGVSFIPFPYSSGFSTRIIRSITG